MEIQKPKKRRRRSTTKYSSSYCKLMLSYFSAAVFEMQKERIKKKAINPDTGQEHIEYERVACDLPMFEAFAKKICVTAEVLEEWRDTHPDFCDAWAKAMDMQKTVLVTNSLHGLYNPMFSKIAAINLFEWRDTSRDDKPKGKKDLQKINDKELSSELDKRILSIKRSANA